VPQDLQIIAYDGTYLADCAGRRLTVVKQDFDTLAEQLAGHIVDAINLAGDRGDGSNGGDGNTAKPADIDIVPVSLRIGDTTRSAA
jgi:LacI family sucrose operon transcriptional repressor